ncbi:hypothetical protein Ade02nite_35550 [Paractinoplanes deccanensis]|uniref:SCP domain-containing protein n=1 Tax=Paractinoplanes deccanensis TaxID=113561 RepID=A0ABQ3Y4K0_9ACTN|nr:hypothetical protein Ade02nite_35550 [Actinoplanes deccanensis]
MVVCAAASALLLAGGVAATSADADERPDTQGWGGFFPGWPFFGGGGSDLSGDGRSDVDGGFAADRDPGDRSTVGGDGNSIADNDDSGDSDMHGAGRPGFAPGPGHQRPAFGQAPAGQAPAGQGPGGAAPGPGAPAAVAPGVAAPGVAAAGLAAQDPAGQRPAAQRPAAQRPGAQRPQAERPGAQGPGGQRPAAQRQQAQPGAAFLDAARRNVTAADVSGNPAAPVQQKVLILVNQNRRRAGCDALRLDRRLIEAANRHAADMARRDYFEHDSPNGDNAGDRVSRTGYDWKRYGENIARGADSAWEVVDGWMHSPVHRENILDCGLHEMGLGLAIARDRTPYWVQDFATPME